MTFTQSHSPVVLKCTRALFAFAKARNAYFARRNVTFTTLVNDCNESRLALYLLPGAWQSTAQLPTAVVPTGSPISYSTAPGNERATQYLTLVVIVILRRASLAEIYVRAWPIRAR